MDGNFSAEHMRYRTNEKDIALSPGMAFMSNPDLYRTHLQSRVEMTQVDGCILYVWLYLIFFYVSQHM
jgi:hypothetical protein